MPVTGGYSYGSAWPTMQERRRRRRQARRQKRRAETNHVLGGAVAPEVEADHDD